MVTCEHCVRKPTVAYQPGINEKRHRVTVTHVCPDRDLARLRVDVPLLAALKVGAGVAVGESCVAVGFGNFAAGTSYRVVGGAVTARGVRHGINVLYSDHRAFGGHSGGPVLNANSAVVGILQRAITPDAPDQETTILPVGLIAEVPAVQVPPAEEPDGGQ